MSRRFLISAGFLSHEDDYAHVVLTIEDIDVLRIKLRHTIFERSKKLDSDLTAMRYSLNMALKTYIHSPEMNIKEERLGEEDKGRDTYVWADDFLDGEVWKELKGDQDLRGGPVEVNSEEVSFTEEGIHFYIMTDDEILSTSSLPYNVLEG
jgi:hypothetical protein